jgi:hypothetical protein
MAKLILTLAVAAFAFGGIVCLAGCAAEEQPAKIQGEVKTAPPETAKKGGAMPTPSSE